MTNKEFIAIRFRADMEEAPQKQLLADVRKLLAQIDICDLTHPTPEAYEAEAKALAQRNEEIRELKRHLVWALRESGLEENWQAPGWREKCQKVIDEIPRNIK